MDIFERVIYNNLIQHRSVVLPGVGTLKVYRTAGTFDKSGNMVSAPVNKIVFTDEIMEGETIVEMVETLSGSSTQEVETLYGAWVKESCTSNNKGVNIGSVGFVRREADGGNVFEPSVELRGVLNPAVATSATVKTETKSKLKKTKTTATDKPAETAKTSKTISKTAKKSEEEVVIPPVPPVLPKVVQDSVVETPPTPPIPPSSPQRAQASSQNEEGAKRKTGSRNNMFLYVVVAVMLLLIAGLYIYSRWEFCDEADEYVEEFYDRDEDCYDGNMPADSVAVAPTDSVESLPKEVQPTPSVAAVKGKFLIIGGLFSEPANADRFVTDLGANSVYAEQIKRPSGNILVSVRGFDTRAQAEEYLSALREKSKAAKDYWIHERGTRIW